MPQSCIWTVFAVWGYPHDPKLIITDDKEPTVFIQPCEHYSHGLDFISKKKQRKTKIKMKIHGGEEWESETKEKLLGLEGLKRAACTSNPSFHGFRSS